MEEVHSQDLLIGPNFKEKNYETFPIKERDSNSTSDGNERHIAQVINAQKKPTKLLKSLKMSQLLNSASSYWVQVCTYK